MPSSCRRGRCRGARRPRVQPGPGDLRGDRPDARGHQADGGGVLRERRGRPDARAARPADRAGALDRPASARDASSPPARQERTPTRSTRSGCPRARPTTSRRVEVTFPSGRTADEICPTEIAVPVWCAHMGTLTFHPWPVRRADVDHPDELRIDLDPQPGTSFPDAVRVAGVARELLEELGIVGFPKTSGNRGVHIYVRIEPRLGVHRPAARRDRLRPRAGPARRRRDHRVVEGGARGADLRRLQPEQPRPHHRLGVLPAPAPRRPGLHPDDLGRAGRRHRPARSSTCSPSPTGSPTATRGRRSTTSHPLEPLLRLWEELRGAR